VWLAEELHGQLGAKLVFVVVTTGEGEGIATPGNDWVVEV